MKLGNTGSMAIKGDSFVYEQIRSFLVSLSPSLMCVLRIFPSKLAGI